MPSYRVTHGDIIKARQSHPKGTVLEMSAEDAAALGSSVELVKEVPKPEATFPEPVKPALVTEFRPDVSAHHKPHKGKDKSK